MIPHTNEYVLVSLTLTQIVRMNGGCPSDPREGVPTLRVNRSPTRQRSDPQDQLRPSTGSTPKRGTRNKVVETTALLDTGSIAGDFINAKVLRGLGGAHLLRTGDSPILICSGLDNNCISSNVILDVDVTFKMLKLPHTIPLHVRISDDSPMDLIFGRDTIRNNNLVAVFPEFFYNTL